MSDMTAVIEPKTDQLNSDSLMTGPITIKITKVSVRPGTEQPVSISYAGDDGKPWKPCKSMARVLVSAWGPDSSVYVGRGLTLYRDPKVKWGGLEVGGIRVSHMSHIENAMTLALTETKQSRKPFTVKPLKLDAKAEKRTTDTAAPSASPEALEPEEITAWAGAIETAISSATPENTDERTFKDWATDATAAPQWAALKTADPTRARAIHKAINEKIAELGA